MDAQDLLAALQVGQSDDDLTVEPTGTHQRMVKDVRAVRRSDHDDPFVRTEAVHLDEQLVERLLALVMPAAQTGAALAADGIDLVDEDDAWGVLLRLLEQVAHAGRAHADIHLDEVGAGHREERHACLTGHCPRKQRLARAGRADEQHALRHARAQRRELFRCLEELNDLLQLLFFFLRARHVIERGLAFIIPGLTYLRLAEAHDLAGAVDAAERAAHHHAHQDDRTDQQQHRQPVDDPRHVGDGLPLIGNVVRRIVVALRRHHDRVDHLQKIPDAGQLIGQHVLLVDLAVLVDIGAVRLAHGQLQLARPQIERIALHLIVQKVLDIIGIDLLILIVRSASAADQHPHQKKQQDRDPDHQQRIAQGLAGLVFVWLQISHSFADPSFATRGSYGS